MKFLIIVLISSQLISQDIGQKMINNGDFDSALNYYQYLLNDEKLSKDDIIYNLATIYSSIDSIPTAEKYFDLAIQDSLNPSSDLSYNRGNMFFKSQMLEESLKSYRNALLKNPDDSDARKNYEFVKNEIEKKQQAQEQNEQQDENTEESENNDNEQKKDQNQENKNRDDKSNNSDKNPEKNNNDNPQNQDISQSSKQENNDQKQIEIDQNVENILNAMKENEKVNKKRKQNNFSNESGKEW
ncbi:MAG: hypothetical protein CMG16_00095 [Candidatus Marinimicrobia bacterium]|nr:hypothetical protein [Candidatus Neomarinimicrobiota bacterium]|tara:strand:+ start:3483 stop:4208 length:726 start_codon:yes stop_codon:yes gene_type:complete